MRRAVIILIALSVAAAALAAALAATQFETANYQITSGVPTVIGEHGRWNGACQALDAPLVTLERPADHGSICTRLDLVTPTLSRSGRAVNCLSRKLNGVLIVYQPQRGFTGPDSLRYGLDFPEGHVSREIVIDIQPGPSVTPALPFDLPGVAALRAGDRVPQCAGESS